MIDKMQWGIHEFILDHGSGRGSTTYDYFLPMDSKLVGLENSISMMEHARQNYSNERIEYVLSVNLHVSGLKFSKVFYLWYKIHLVHVNKRFKTLLYLHIVPSIFISYFPPTLTEGDGRIQMLLMLKLAENRK